MDKLKQFFIKNGKNNRQVNTRIFGLALLAAILLILVFNRGEVPDSAPTQIEHNEKTEKIVTEKGGPESGTVFYLKYDNNPAVFHLVNKTTADVCVRCPEGLFNRSVINFYLRAGEEVTLSVPVGYYELHIATGEKWVDSEKLFGENTLYFRDILSNGLEFSRKKTCEFTIEEGFVNLIGIAKEQY